MKSAGCFFSTILLCAIGTIASAQDGMMDQNGQIRQTPADTAGAQVFRTACAGCHPNGGNVVIPSLPLKGSRKLANFENFLDFIRHPTMPDGSRGSMPPFPPARLSDHQARELYQYLTSAEGETSGGYGMGPGMRGGGYGMGGMMGGYGRGQGMMGGYGMGLGLRGPAFYDQGTACNKFLDETAKLRKKFYDMKFEYSEKTRDPETTMGTLSKLRNAIGTLWNQINAENTNACWW